MQPPKRRSFLSAGTYRLVVIAHSCDGSATIISAEKVTFPNNKVTDTFYYYGDLVVGTEKQSYDLTADPDWDAVNGYTF